MRNWRKTLLAFTVAGALLARPALACPVMEKASPRVGATLDTTPRAVTLTFSGPVELDRSQLDVSGPSGAPVTAGTLHRSGDGSTVSIDLKPDLEPGRYKVRWSIHCHCQEEDDTAIPGSYGFTIR